MAMGETNVNSYRNSAQGLSPHLDDYLRPVTFARAKDYAAARAGHPGRRTTTGEIPLEAELAPPKLTPQ